LETELLYLAIIFTIALYKSEYNRFLRVFRPSTAIFFCLWLCLCTHFTSIRFSAQPPPSNNNNNNNSKSGSKTTVTTAVDDDAPSLSHSIWPSLSLAHKCATYLPTDRRSDKQTLVPPAARPLSNHPSSTLFLLPSLLSAFSSPFFHPTPPTPPPFFFFCFRLLLCYFSFFHYYFHAAAAAVADVAAAAVAAATAMLLLRWLHN